MRKAALKLLSWGWSVIPIPHRLKYPRIKWSEFQNRTPTQADIDAWWPENANEAELPGIGVVCGSVSGNLVCLDFDDGIAMDYWVQRNPKLSAILPRAESARGGHIFLRLRTPPPSTTFRIPEFDDRAKLGEILSDGKLVVLPPTIHPNGTRRKWIQPPKADIVIDSLLETGIELGSPTLPASIELQRGTPLLENETVQTGMRHHTLLRAAGRLKRTGLPDAVILESLRSLNRCAFDPPLEDGEITRAANWANKLANATYDNLPELEKMLAVIRRPSGGIHICIPSTTETTPDGSGIVPMSAYLKDTAEVDMPWIVEGFLPQSFLVILGGTSKAGKSCLVTALALAVAEGKDFMGCKTLQSPVIWVPYEESRIERAYALRQFQTQSDDFYLTEEKPLIDTPDGLAKLERWINDTGAKLLIIDPLYAANEAETLTDGKSARNALQGLKDLCNRTQASAVVIHHFTKNVSAGLVRERLADSNQIAAAASMDILMDAQDQNDGSRLIKLVCRGRGIFANQTWVLRSEGPAHFELVGKGVGLSIEAMNRDRVIIEYLNISSRQAKEDERPIPYYTVEEIAEAVGLHPKTVRNAIPAIAESKVIVEGPKRGRFKTYGGIA